MARKRKFLLVLWILAVVIAATIYYKWWIDVDMLGIVENKVHLAGSQEDGRISELFVKIGDKVAAGQIMAKLDVSDLEAIKEGLTKELESISEILVADRKRFSLEHEQLRLQLESRATVLLEKHAELQARRVERDGLDHEIKRLRDAENAGLGHSRDLSDLVVKRDFLNRWIKERVKSKPAKMRSLLKDVPKAGTSGNGESVLTSMLGNRLERANEIGRLLIEVEQRIIKRSIIAPTDSYVVQVLTSVGDTIEAFLPVITCEETGAAFVEAYMPEHANMDIKIGYQAEVFSRRSADYHTEGVVSFIHPGFSAMPQRFLIYGQLSWARKIRIKLKNNHRLLPGEAVHVHIMSGSRASVVSLNEVKAAGEKKEKSLLNTIENAQIKKIKVPEGLYKKSRFEPSGILWLDDIKRFLIVSDDTGYKGSNNHAPWIFLMDEAGQVEAEPVVLKGVKKLNDLEAVTMDNDGFLYLISSQNITKKGKRKPARNYMLKVKRNGREFVVVSKVNFFELLYQAFSKDELKSLGLDSLVSDGKVELNIEGATWKDGSLYFGLKQPATHLGAIIWKLDNPDTMFETQKLQKDQLNIFSRIKLPNDSIHSGGFSDLHFDAKNRLFALSTIPGVSNDDQKSGVYLINNFVNKQLKAEKLRSFKGMKPEGICAKGDKFIIVFDNDQGVPSFVEWDYK